MKQIGIKSTKLYEIVCNTGVRHYISLTCREYKSGKCIYILKIIFTIKENDKIVYKKAYINKDNALDSLQKLIIHQTLDNIQFEKSLPF